MKTMQQSLRYLVLALLLLSLGGCRRTMDKMIQKIHLDRIEEVRPTGLTGVEIDVTATNGTAYNLQLENTTVTLFYKGTRVATMQLIEPLTLNKRTTARLTSQWAIKIANPLALLPVMRDLRQGNHASLTVSLSLEGRGGPLHKTINREQMAISDFLAIFGLKVEQLTQMIP